MTKNNIISITITFACLLLLMGGGVICYKLVNYAKLERAMIYEKIYYMEDIIAAQNEELNSLRLAQPNRKDTLRVVCLGNSITYHPYKEDIEWYSEWGMAASRKENDYVHHLETMIEVSGVVCEMRGFNIAEWELNLDINAVCKYDSIINTADVVVVRIGENVSKVNQFEKSVEELVAYLAKEDKQLIVTGCFWESTRKESALIKAAREHGATFVSIDWIGKRYTVYPNVGDTLYDTNGEPYIMTKDFIREHPNDKGMEMIANEIYQHIKL